MDQFLGFVVREIWMIGDTETLDCIMNAVVFLRCEFFTSAVLDIMSECTLLWKRRLCWERKREKEEEEDRKRKLCRGRGRNVWQ